MCGIAGILDLTGKAEPSSIRSMCDALVHRGPDDEGYLAVDLTSRAFHSLVGRDSQVEGTNIADFHQITHLFFGHRRLSIIDLSPAGHQPMSNRDKTIWIVFNGEIYNFLSLRRELSAEGWQFHTGTDTEVILAAYERWGYDCLSRFNGMWAFVIYDSRNHRLFGARDRFGVKPLYYASHGECFAFASEIKSLLRLPGMNRKLRPESAFDFLVLGIDSFSESTLFTGIKELLPATAFTYDLSAPRWHCWTYYHLQPSERWEKIDPTRMETYVRQTRELMISAVRLHLNSDVALGSMLSGGLDSSSIVCIIDRLLREEKPKSVGTRQSLYTASYRDYPFDETPYALSVSEKTQSVLHRAFPDSHDLLQNLETLALTHELPFISTSIYAQFCVCRLAAESGTKVLLDGQGGDEIFAGYGEFYSAFFAEMLRHGNFNRFLREWQHLANAPLSKISLCRQMRNSILKRLVPPAVKILYFRTRDPQMEYLHPEFWKTHASRIAAYRGRDAFSLNPMMAGFTQYHQLRTLLRYEDRNTMHFSLESRTPFADDQPLIDYLFSIPGSYKIVDGFSKSLLREAMKDYLPPRVASRRDKIGFLTPEYNWLQAIGETLQQYLTPDLGDIFDLKRLKSDWSGLLAIQPRIGVSPLWRFISFAVWKKVFMVN